MLFRSEPKYYYNSNYKYYYYSDGKVPCCGESDIFAIGISKATKEVEYIARCITHEYKLTNHYRVKYISNIENAQKYVNDLLKFTVMI